MLPTGKIRWPVICSKFITFAVTKTTRPHRMVYDPCCDLLKIHYLCGDKDNLSFSIPTRRLLWFAQNSLPLRWQRQRSLSGVVHICSCDLLKIHYLCGDKDNQHIMMNGHRQLWFAQNSLPLRWQRQLKGVFVLHTKRCDLLKIHYLCGDKDNLLQMTPQPLSVVICSKFITFAVTKTT